MIRKLKVLLMGIFLSAAVFVACEKDEEEDNTSNPPDAPMVNNPLHVYGDYFYVNWTGVVGATGYKADIATDQDFNNILPDYNDNDVEINGMFIVEGLNPNTKYYVRMRSYNANGTSGNSSFKEFTTRSDNNLPNSNMEEWIEYQNYDSPYPNGVWTSANKVRDLDPSIYPALLFKTDDAQEGNFAAKMVTDTAQDMPLLTGSLSTGIFAVNLTNHLESMISGVPYKSRPTRFQGYYKYMGVDGDSCEIRTTLTKWNFSEKKKDLIGEVVFRTTDLVSEYTYFDFEIEYFMDENPDSIDMVFAASAGGEYFIGGVHSTLYIDNFNLVFE